MTFRGLVLLCMFIVGLRVDLLYTSSRHDKGYHDLHAHLAIADQIKRDGCLHDGNMVGTSCQFSWLGDDDDSPSAEDYLRKQREEKNRKEQYEKNRREEIDRARTELRQASLSQNQGVLSERVRVGTSRSSQVVLSQQRVSSDSSTKSGGGCVCS